MIQESVYTEWAGKKLLGIMVIAGLSIAGVSFFMLADSLNPISAFSNLELTMLCNDGLCIDSITNSIPFGSFIQQGTEMNFDAVKNSKESFTSLAFNKNSNTIYEVTDTSAILLASKDSFLRESIKNVNEGGNSFLRVMGIGDTNNRALIAFDQKVLKEIASDKTLESAKLRLFIVSNDGPWENGQGLSLHMVDSDWTEGTATNAPYGSIIGTQKGTTWNCSSDAECADWSGGKFVEIPTDTVTITNDIDGQWIEFDVTQDVLDFLTDSENNGWIIMKTNEDVSGRVNFAAKEASDNKPQLSLTFT